MPLSLGLWGPALPSCSWPCDVDSCTGKSHAGCCHNYQTQTVSASLDVLPPCLMPAPTQVLRPRLCSICFTSVWYEKAQSLLKKEKCAERIKTMMIRTIKINKQHFQCVLQSPNTRLTAWPPVSWKTSSVTHCKPHDRTQLPDSGFKLYLLKMPSKEKISVSSVSSSGIWKPQAEIPQVSIMHSPRPSFFKQKPKTMKTKYQWLLASLQR